MHWEMHEVSTPVTVKAVEPSERIEIVWPSSGGPTAVESCRRRMNHLASRPLGPLFSASRGEPVGHQIQLDPLLEEPSGPRALA
jgi:hypothetical protein